MTRNHYFFVFLIYSFAVLIYLGLSKALSSVGLDLSLALYTFWFFLFWLVSIDRGLLSPVMFFLLSCTVFVFSRAFLYKIGMEPVEAGIQLGEKSYVIAFNEGFLIALFISISYIVSVFFLKSPMRRFIKNMFFDYRIGIGRYDFSPIFLLFSIFFLALFLIKSYGLIGLVSNSSYLELAGGDALSSHIKYFFIGKNALILYLIFSCNRNKYLHASFLLFFSSIGFGFIGLRGYLIVYFLLFAYFFSLRGIIGNKSILLAVASMVYASSVIMEYRLGFDLYSGVWDVAIKTIHQQGATFEVLYGVVNFSEEVNNCVESSYRVSSNVDFGSCVDRSRGVFWEYGGFATSFFAEAVYLGFFYSVIYSAIFGFFLAMLDRLSKLQRKVSTHSLVPSLLLFLVLPNLVYFARGDVNDFIFKTLISLILIFSLRVSVKFLRT